MRRLLLLFICGLFLISCDPAKDFENPNATIEAYVPVYGSAELIKEIKVEPAQPTHVPGKIYAYRNYIFQNDIDEGIHIIDNSFPQNPHKIVFISIPGNSEISVKSNYLYANNYEDLVVYDILDPAKPVFVKRVEKVFALVNQKYPMGNGYFECPDPSKGIVVKWELQTIKTPKCRR